MESVWLECVSFLKTLLCFIVALMLMPLLLLSFLCAHFGNELANYLLSIKYPNLTISKSKKIRTLIDTPKNAGIFHFLLQVEGPCEFEHINRAYSTQLIELKDKTGVLRYPMLRQQLVTCWGHYAWVNDSSGFNINNHVLLSTPKYRGRAVSESNIQEYVSELAAKYIPSDLPQWQVTVIPNSDDTQPYYILIKVHHLIIAEEQDLHVSEMLLLQDPEKKSFVDALTATTPAVSKQLSHFVRQPEHISKLLQHVQHLISCRWQQFIYEFESLDTPDGVKSQPDARNLSQLLSLSLIVLVNVSLSYWRQRALRRKLKHRSGHSYRHDVGMLQTIYILLVRELEQRNLNWTVARAALTHSLQPLNMVKCWTRFIWHLLLHNFILLPYYVYYELLALRDVLLRGQTSYSDTHCARLYLYVPLLFYAQLELVKICYELFMAPRNIYDVLFVQPTKELNILHQKSYAGRKIVSFSRSIDGSQLRERHEHMFGQQLRESDFSLACLAGAVHDYFNTYTDKAAVPALLNTTCRTIAQGYFTDRSGDKSSHIGGVIFLQLPLGPPDALKALQLHEIVERIRKQQIMIYLASIGQTKYSLLTSLLPHVLTKIFINFFSYNFPVTITEVYGPADPQFQAAWGQRVQDVLLFRPPQSKTCLSLNLHRYGDRYRLAVMADTHLAPDHTLLTRSFERYMETVAL
ncbi:CG33120 [Drosophila busckii]|uniref:CG33120 n=1 Tax=Drosophila busckii TaxID=30019 RepID=A0A0M4ERB9_DROBS|nr:CG33120 [Drosophila busckii]